MDAHFSTSDVAKHPITKEYMHMEKDKQEQLETCSSKEADILVQPRGIKREVASDFADPRKAAPKADLNTENSLELHSMSRQERHRYNKEHKVSVTSDMTRSQRIKYFFNCNKWKLLVVAMIVVSITWISFAVYQSKKPTALAYAVVNSPDPWSVDTSVIDDYKTYYNYKSSARVRYMQNLEYNKATFESNYNSNADEYSAFPLLCEENAYDVIISDKAGVECCSYINLIYPLDTYTDTLQQLFEDQLKDKVVTAQDSANHTSTYAIDISGTDFAKRMNLGYDDVYLSFPGNSDGNIERITKLLNYIFDLGLYDEDTQQ